jgi:hypothetical protein
MENRNDISGLLQRNVVSLPYSWADTVSQSSLEPLHGEQSLATETFAPAATVKRPQFLRKQLSHT